MKEKNSTFQAYIKYLLPSMFSMMLMALYTFTDTFVVGQKLGSVALGAMGICTPIITVTYALGFLFGMGGGALYSIEMGKKKAEKANSIFTTSLIMTFVLGVFLAIGGNIFAEPFARFLGADDENLSYVMPYLRCVVSYIPGFMIDVFLISYMKNDGHPTVAMAATSVGTGLNIVLDFLFVFGFKLGMFGAAIATCIGSFIAIIFNFSYIYIKKLNIRINLKNLTPDSMLRIIKTGFSVFILECSSGVVTFVFINRAANLYGSAGSSIYTIIMNWTLIAFNLVMGIAQSVQPLISVNYGAKNFRYVKTYRQYALVSSLIAGILYLLIGYGLTDSLVSVFANDNPELITETISAFRLYLPAYFFMGTGIVIGIYFQSIEYAVRSMLVMSLRGIILPVIGAVAMSAMFGKTGLWLTVPIAELITSAVAVVLMFVSEKSIVANKEIVSAQKTTAEKPLIITISREFGSGGRRIGQLVGEKLGIPVYDKEIGAFTEVQSGFNSDVVNSSEDTNSYPNGLFVHERYTPIRNEIYQAQCDVIRKLAKKGSCVIIGRCADDVLNGEYPLLSVFVHAPLEMRTARVMEYDECSEKQAIRKIQESDKSRKEYHDFYTGHKWGKSQNYNLTIDSSLGIEKAANLICLLSNQK